MVQLVLTMWYSLILDEDKILSLFHQTYDIVLMNIIIKWQTCFRGKCDLIFHKIKPSFFLNKAENILSQEMHFYDYFLKQWGNVTSSN